MPVTTGKPLPRETCFFCVGNCNPPHLTKKRAMAGGAWGGGRELGPRRGTRPRPWWGGGGGGGRQWGGTGNWDVEASVGAPGGSRVWGWALIPPRPRTPEGGGQGRTASTARWSYSLTPRPSPLNHKPGILNPKSRAFNLLHPHATRPRKGTSRLFRFLIPNT